MTDETPEPVETALVAAQLRAIRTALLDLHKALLDEQRVQYQRAHGPIGGPHDALHLAMNDPAFAWLRPILELIVTADERLAADIPVAAADVQAFGTVVRELLRGDGGGPEFRAAYHRVLQDLPDAVVLHGRVLAAIKG